MKQLLSASLLVTAVAGAGPEDYVNFVRQIQQDSGVEWDVSVDSKGSMLSPEGVGPMGSLFQLWSIHSLSAYEYHLDEEFVSAYSPEAVVEIETGDPYTPIARTRVDQPFTVRIGVSGLITGAGSGVDAPPTSAGKVLLRHAAGNYAAGRHSFETGNGNAGSGGENDEPNHQNVGSATIEQNGTIVLEYPSTVLTGPDLTKVEGEEVWSVLALEDGEAEGNPLVEGDVLESATLQVWPIADAAISGVVEREVYSEVPPITVVLNDLYPDSTTFVRIVKEGAGGQVSNYKDVASSFVIINDSIPQNRVLALDELDEYFPGKGSYTIQVLHRTPFGTDLLASMDSIVIDPRIAVRASVYSSE